MFLHGSRQGENKIPITYFKSCSHPDPVVLLIIVHQYLSSNTIQNPYILPYQNSTFSVVVTDTNGGCSDSASIDIISICDTCYSPNFVIDSLTCFGSDNASITAFPVGINSSFWIFELKDYSTNSLIAVDSNVTTSFLINGLSSGTYVLSSTDSSGCFADTIITISDGYIPIVSTSNDTTICQGDTVQLEAFGGINYNWLTTDSISNIFINNPLLWPSNTTLYSVIVSDINACEDTTDVLITVNPKPIVNAGFDQYICYGDSTSLNASGSAVSFSWDNNISDGILFEATTSSNFIVNGIDLNNCSNKDTVTVNVLALPFVNADQIIVHDSIQLSVVGADNYIWIPNNDINNNLIPNPTVYPTILTEYIVTGTDTNNCSNTDTLKVEINDLPVIITSNDTVICLGDRISILASGGGTYQWLNTDSISDVSISSPQVAVFQYNI